MNKTNEFFSQYEHKITQIQYYNFNPTSTLNLKVEKKKNNIQT